MLVILNGAPKSGSTWLVQIIKAMKILDQIPQEYQNQKWKNSSILNSVLDDFVDKFDYQNHDYFCKQHWANSKQIKSLNLLHNPNIKMVNIIRDIRDVLVSRYFHDLRLNLTQEKNVNNYYWEQGKSIIKAYMNYHHSWHANELEVQPFLCSYEQLHSDFIKQVQELVNYLELDSSINLEDIKKIKNITSFDNKKNKGEGKFFRKGIVGDWHNYLSNSVVKDLEETVIKNGYLETKKNMLKRYKLNILKEIDFGIQN